MTQEEEKLARRTLAALPNFGDEAASAASIGRLKGLTNRVYRVAAAGGVFCLRIPGEGSAAIIDRRNEEANARAAADADAAPEVLHFGADGVMLTRYVEGVPLSAGGFRDRPGSIERAARALRILHGSGATFRGVFDVFSVNAAYVRLLDERGKTISDGRRSLVTESEGMRDILTARPRALRPCHCDPTGANLIDTGERVWLIDWEYSAMNHPMWDLAYLSLQSNFDDDQDAELLASYSSRRRGRADDALMEAFKSLVELLSALWALVQHSAGNNAADFESYAAATFERCRARTRSERFAEALAILRRN